MATIPTQPAKTSKNTVPASSQASAKSSSKAPGLSFSRHFTKPGISPFDEITWEFRDAIIQDFKGKIIFEQKNVEVPADWSMTATNIVASKYLHGLNGTEERESGVRALITRVAESIRDWGIRDGYFATPEDAGTFFAELVHLLLNQKVAFNSPVWFNVGCDRLEPNSDAHNWHWENATGEVEFSAAGYTRPQCSACFINSVNDSLDSILTLAKTEGMLFKWGSGAGSNLSSIRGSMETLSGGGTASGPLSFMRGFDAFAGVIKSGGKTRRAAKMVILNVDHPDIMDFIDCKSKEEAKATWECGDPGMQFDTTINKWHTSKNTARINASNPCSEYMFLDNSACNLASFNLMKFVNAAGVFEIEAYRHAISVVITAMELLLDNSGYPTEAICLLYTSPSPRDRQKS